MSKIGATGLLQPSMFCSHQAFVFIFNKLKNKLWTSNSGSQCTVSQTLKFLGQSRHYNKHERIYSFSFGRVTGASFEMAIFEGALTPSLNLFEGIRGCNGRADQRVHQTSQLKGWCEVRSIVLGINGFALFSQTQINVRKFSPALPYLSFTEAVILPNVFSKKNMIYDSLACRSLLPTMYNYTSLEIQGKFFVCFFECLKICEQVCANAPYSL